MHGKRELKKNEKFFPTAVFEPTIFRLLDYAEYNRMQNFANQFTAKYTTDTDINTPWNIFVEESTRLIRALQSSLDKWRHQEIIQKKNRTYNTAKKTGKTKDWDRFHQLKRQTQTTCKQIYNDYISNMLEEDSTTNPKTFWSFIKSKTSETTGDSPLRKEGILHSDPVNKANILNDHFVSVFTQEDMYNIPDKGDSEYPDLPEITIHPDGTRKLLYNIDHHKATGPDNIPGQLLKEFAQEVTPILRLIFSASLHQRRIPDEWKEATVTPLLKN